MTTYRCPSTPSRRFASPLALLGISIAAAAATICMLPAAAWAADESSLQRFAMCQDSWLDWSQGDPRMKQYTTFIESRLTEAEGAAFTPKTPMSAFGLPITQVFPQSVGTGVGFSVLVSSDLATVRKLFEKQLGKPLTCATSDGTQACQLEVAAKKTVVLLADGRSRTLAGCYYFYQR